MTIFVTITQTNAGGLHFANTKNKIEQMEI
jgi:hypothetical protein